VAVDKVFLDLADGWTVTAQVRETPADPVALLEWSTTNGRVLFGTAQITTAVGIITVTTMRLTHTPVATAGMNPVAARYDCQITKAGTVHLVRRGNVNIEMGVTR
jgi:hypothetical protein